MIDWQGESTVFKAHESSVRSVQFSNDGRCAWMLAGNIIDAEQLPGDGVGRQVHQAVERASPEVPHVAHRCVDVDIDSKQHLLLQWE